MTMDSLFKIDTKAPKVEKTRVNLFIPNNIVLKLNEMSVKYGLTRTGLIMQAVAEKIKREGEEKNSI